jgi:exosortase
MTSIDADKNGPNLSSEARTKSILKRDHGFFAVFLALSSCFFWKTLSSLVFYSLHDASGSHIVLIPFISLFLIYSERGRIFSKTRRSLGPGTGLIVAGILTYWAAGRFIPSIEGNQSLVAAAIAVILTWAGGFLAFYGGRAMRAAAFPLTFLLLMVPVPEAILARIIYAMQQGSTYIAVLIFKLVGVPVFRQGFVLSVPGFAIEIAQECSGIRSSIALFITAVLATHYFLRTPWKILLFIALVFPIAVIKNGVRVATLTLLSIYVDPSFLFGNLHRDGGFVFFGMALAILVPILFLLQKSEIHAKPVDLADNDRPPAELAHG